MKTFFQISILFCLLTIGSSLAYSCSCIDPSQRQRFRKADSVFVGKITEFRQLTDAEYNKFETNEELKYFPYYVTFKFEKQRKGKKQAEIVALADLGVGSCGGLELPVGEQFLIYAPRTDGQFLIYRTCSPNRTVKEAKDEIDRLNNFFFRAYTFLYPYPKF